MPQYLVEAAGEAAPMTESLVFKTLERASGTNAQQVGVASSQLSNWEIQPGYYSALQDVYANLNYDQRIRFQAIIQLKNGIDTYWRKTSIHVISKQEKLKIRTKAIEAGMREPSPQLGLQNALMLSKIVRYEFPHEWPEVISILASNLRPITATLQHLTNALNLTLPVIKELATARLQRSRNSLKQAAPELFQILGYLYVEHSRFWMPLLQPGSNQGTLSTDAMVVSCSALKVIRRVMIAGFDFPHRDANVVHLSTVLQQQFGDLWSMMLPSRDRKHEQLVEDLLTKHLAHITKLHLEMARTHPAAFALLPGCISLMENYWDLIKAQGREYLEERSSQDWEKWALQEQGAETAGSPLLERAALKGLLLFRACLKMAFRPVQTFKYLHPEDKEDRKRSVDLIKSELLNDAFVVEMLDIVVTMFFALRPGDIREWVEEPSEWEKREEEIEEAWEFSIRPCSEKLFLDLMINYKDILTAKLIHVFYRYASLDNHEIFLKDSIYSAVGLAAAVLHTEIDFNAFLRSTFLHESQLLRPGYHILRRRIAVVLGQWTPVIPGVIDKSLVYHIFASLLSADEWNDLVVCVTAGRQLRHVLEPFEFSYNEFAPYATSIFHDLMRLIRDVELIETKMALLETVRVAVQRMEAHIEPFSNEIMGILPSLWVQSGEQHLMKQAILTMITTIVTSLGKRSLKYHSDILPLIRDSVRPESETLVYLLEEALDLWSAVIQQTPSSDPSPSSELLSLSLSLLPLLELGSDSLRQTFDIIESYILISPSTVLLPTFLDPLLSSLNLLIGKNGANVGPTRREITRCARLLEGLIKILLVRRHFPDEATYLQAGQHLVLHSIEKSFLATFLSFLKEAHDYHQGVATTTTSTPAIIGPAETELFSVLARLTMLSPRLFIEAVNAASGPTAAMWVVTEWMAHFENIGDVYQKKLHALSITNLFSVSSPPPPFMLERLQSMMSIWTDIITELGEDAPQETKGDYLYQPALSEASQPSSEWTRQDEAPEEERRSEVCRHDPVYQINIRELVATTIQNVVAAVGGIETFQISWLSSIDRTVVNSFADLGLL